MVLMILYAAALANGETVRFAVLGDTRGDEPSQPVNDVVFSQIVNDIAAADPPVQFVLVTGDLVLGSLDDAVMAAFFQQWRQLAQSWYDANYFGAKVYPVPGNHDEINPLFYLQVWQNAFPELPDNGPANDQKMTYSFDVGPCHIAVVNSSIPSLFRAHTVDLDWLSNDLANSRKPVKLVLGHEPAYPMSSHIGSSLDARPTQRDQFWKLLADNQVRAYFCGHEHTYDRSIKDNVTQIITGGGGAPGSPFHYLIVDADDQDVTISVYYQDNNTLHQQYKLSDTQAAQVIPDAPVSQLSGLLSFFSCPLGFSVVLLGMFGLIAIMGNSTVKG